MAIGSAAGGLATSRLINRVLRDYPLARKRLAAHAEKRIAVVLAPLAETRLRITGQGEVEPVGEGGDDAIDVAFKIPLTLLPALAAGDDAALTRVEFSGDSELASLLSELARHLKWDFEEDLSHVIGDIASHRVVDAIRRTRDWREEAGERFRANVAEYLTEESRAFMTASNLELLARANETLRDDVARLEARLDRLTSAHAET